MQCDDCHNYDDDRTIIKLMLKVVVSVSQYLPAGCHSRLGAVW